VQARGARAPRPLVGITTYGPLGEPATISLPHDYVRAVAMAGGTPVLLAASEVPPEALLDSLDALVLAGGGDLDPALHTRETHATIYGVSRERDEFELALARAALALPDLPVLGICRGMQVLNVALGGDLELHLPDARGEAVLHRAPPRDPTFHPVRLEPGTPLAEIFGDLEFSGCSWHHQEVRRLGRGLVPVAFAPDGVIEGLVYERGRFALGVQWHPEMQVDDDPRQRRIFDALVARARDGR
jgi:putative glutamine amidotransferase